MAANTSSWRFMKRVGFEAIKEVGETLERRGGAEARVALLLLTPLLRLLRIKNTGLTLRRGR